MKVCTVLFSIIISTQLAFGQLFGFELPKNKKEYTIPFRYSNDFILVDLVINDKLPLTFIFDTGAEYTLLTKPFVAQLLDLKYDRTFTIYGSDLHTKLDAHLARNIKLKIKNLVAPSHDVLVLEEDVSAFDNLIGEPIHGILGGNIFCRYKVKIDYRKKKITLFNALPNSNLGFPIEVENCRPYIDIEMGNKTKKVLIDTGASLSFLFHRFKSDSSSTQNMIYGNIGNGLGGNLLGYIGRYRNIKVANNDNWEPIIYYQIVSNEQVKDKINRDGIIGNSILKRYDLYLDYPNQRAEFKPNKNYFKKQKQDRSGLQIINSGANFEDYFINFVYHNSPGAKAGLLSGDKLISVNRVSIQLFGLSGIINRLKSNKNRPIRIKYKRNGQFYWTTLVLEDYIKL